jgi:Zn-dependent M16 (insulinase) family peptidase
MQSIARILFQKELIACGVTGESSSFDPVRGALKPYLGGLPDGRKPAAEMRDPFTPVPVRLGWSWSVPVSYVSRVFRAVPFNHPDAAPLLVLAKLLRAGYLHREIREKGGAYGGMASYNPEAGIFSLLSYRDPQLTRTLNVYDDAASWAAAGKFGSDEITEAILAVFSDLDRPLSPGARGHREFANTRQGLTREMRQTLREGVLATGRETLQRVAAEYLLEGRETSAVSVIAGEEALKKANEELGDKGLKIERI